MLVVLLLVLVILLSLGALGALGYLATRHPVLAMPFQFVLTGVALLAACVIPIAVR